MTESKPTPDRRNPPRGSALVTGGTSGIGAAVARQLAARGHDLLLTFRSDQAKADALQSALRADFDVRVETFAGDAFQEGYVERLLAFHREKLGEQPVQLLMHGAGRYLPDDEKERLLGGMRDFSAYDYYQEIYPKSFIRLIEGVIERMPDEHGRIVTLSSPGCTPATRVAVGYDMPGQAKASLQILVRMYAQKLAARRITVNTVIPGIVPTPGWVGRTPAEIEAFASQIVPMKRAIPMEDVANAICFLLSEQARSITGAALPVDGGRNLT